MRERNEEQLQKMVEYCEERRGCRHARLQAHFGDAQQGLPSGRCGGGCDNCRNRGSRAWQGECDDNGNQKAPVSAGWGCARAAPLP